MAIPSVDKWIYRTFTLKEITEALATVYSQPRLTVLPLNDVAVRMMQDAIMDQWEITQKELIPCPNCDKMAEDGHCPYCDYPYNNK